MPRGPRKISPELRGFVKEHIEVRVRGIAKDPFNMEKAEIVYDVIRKKPKRKVPEELKWIDWDAGEKRIGHATALCQPVESYAGEMHYKPTSMKKRGLKKYDKVASIGLFYPLHTVPHASKHYEHGIGGEVLDKILRDLKEKRGVKGAYAMTDSVRMKRLLRSRGFTRTRKFKDVLAKRL